MLTLPEFEIDRLIDSDESEKLIGVTVEDNEPNVTEAGIYRDSQTGEVVLLYMPHPGDTSSLRRAILGTGMSTTLRAGGTRNASRTFGMATRSVVLKRESCRPASLSWDNPEAQMILNQAASALAKSLRELLPEIYEQDSETLEQVLPEWRMTEDSLWTSGVINQASQLPYHRDRANFETWSAMPVLRRGMSGGHLSMPEYGITVNCRDGWSLLFNGHRYLHGVTPMQLKAKDGYRYSIVFYALRGMKDCHTYAVEVGEARRNRTLREEGMVSSMPDNSAPTTSAGRTAESSFVSAEKTGPEYSS
jgi:hypothetical protein